MIVEIECPNCKTRDVAVLNEDGSYFLNEGFLVYNFNTCNQCE